MANRTIRFSASEEKRIERIMAEEGKSLTQVVRESLNFRYQQKALVEKVVEIERFLGELLQAVGKATEKTKERTALNDKIHESVAYARLALEAIIPEAGSNEVAARVKKRFEEFKESKAQSKEEAG